VQTFYPQSRTRAERALVEARRRRSRLR